MHVQLGCGTQLFPPPWVNIDPRTLGSDDPDIQIRRGDAINTGLEAGTVEVMFSNAMFEHIFVSQQVAALKEWRRVLTPTGFVTAIGIPDFTEVCKQYLTAGPGVTGPTFDLFEAYRYVNGFPEGHLGDFDWDTWNTTERPDESPPTYLLQMHKAIFDEHYLNRLLLKAGLAGTIFRYTYRNEPCPLNLAFIAGHEHHTLAELTEAIPFIDEFINPRTVVEVTRFGSSRMADLATQWG
jgi:predicted SAM-dependent methyltransferase